MSYGEEQPDWIAQLDQALRAMPDMAKVMRAYYQALVEEGFTEAQALGLTVAFQSAMQADR